MTLMLIIAVWLVSINVAAFLAFGWDKLCAENKRRRTPESYLLLLALLGGAAGAIAGQQLFRHKTRKEPFRSSLYLMGGFNVVVFAALCVPEVRELLWSVFVSGTGAPS